MQTTLNKKFANFKYWHEIEKKLNSFTSDISKAKSYLKKMGLNYNYWGDKRQRTVFVGVDTDVKTCRFGGVPWVECPIATYRNIDSHWFVSMNPPHSKTGYYQNIGSVAIHRRRRDSGKEAELLESVRRSDCTGSIQHFVCNSVQFGDCQWYRYGYMSSKDDFTRKDLIQILKKYIKNNIKIKQEYITEIKELEARLKPQLLTTKKLAKAKDIIKASFDKMEKDICKIFKDFKWHPRMTDPDSVIHNLTAYGSFKTKLDNDSDHTYLLGIIENRQSEVKEIQRQNAYLVDVIKHLYSLKEDHPKTYEFLVWCVEHAYEKNLYSKEQKEEYLCQIKKDLKTKTSKSKKSK